MNKTINKLRFILNKKQKISFFFTTCLMIAASFLEMASVGFLIPVVSIIIDGDLQNSYINLDFLIKITQNFTNQELLLFVFSIFALLFFMKFLFTIFFLYKKSVFIYLVRNDLSRRIFKSFLNRPYDFHQSTNTSKLAINCKYEVDLFTANILFGGLELLSDVVLAFLLIFLLFFLEPNLTIAVLIFFVSFIYFFQLILKKRSKIWAKERQEFDALLNKVIQEGLGSIKEIILNLKENFFINKLVYYLKRNSIVEIRANIAFETPKPLMEFIAIMSFVLIFFVLIYFGYESQDIITLLGLYAAVSFKLLPSFNRIMSNIQKIRAGVPVVNFIYNELKSTDSSDKNMNLKNSNIAKPMFLNSTIEIKNLNFSYKDIGQSSKKTIFENCNFKINRGEYIGLVGSSGTGKSTFLNIISGLIEDYEGEVLIDGKNIKNLNKNWSDRVAYISQDPFFLDETIKNNVAFAEDEANIDEEKVWKALEAAQLFDFVNSLKNKLNNVIGEKGTTMSAGQLQRLAISRALYDDFDLIILDESLNALDSINESKILKVLKDLKNKNKTIILISHHLSNLRDCGKILQIEDKKIIQKK
jgi:ATP-binding cassette, subfamily B, bacterial PglK